MNRRIDHRPPVLTEWPGASREKRDPTTASRAKRWFTCAAIVLRVGFQGLEVQSHLKPVAEAYPANGILLDLCRKDGAEAQPQQQQDGKTNCLLHDLLSSPNATQSLPNTAIPILQVGLAQALSLNGGGSKLRCDPGWREIDRRSWVGCPDCWYDCA